MNSIGSSELYESEAAARLKQIVIASNNGIAQDIYLNRTDILDTLTDAEIYLPVDDLGNTILYLVIYYNRPKILSYLISRGINMNLSCDSLNFGTPIYYCVQYKRLELIQLLYLSGIILTHPCEFYFNKSCVDYINLKNDPILTNFLTNLLSNETKAWNMFYKNFLKHKLRKKYLIIRNGIIKIQSLYRGKKARLAYKYLLLNLNLSKGLNKKNKKNQQLLSNLTSSLTSSSQLHSNKPPSITTNNNTTNTIPKPKNKDKEDKKDNKSISTSQNTSKNNSIISSNSSLQSSLESSIVSSSDEDD